MAKRDGVNRWAEHSHASTEKEIAQEKAASLGRAGRRAEVALQSLAEHDSRRDGDPTVRQELVEEAGEALFFYLVQREACGLRDTAGVLRELNVPSDVERRIGLRRRQSRT
jgi:hypothetical protein